MNPAYAVFYIFAISFPIDLYCQGHCARKQTLSISPLPSIHNKGCLLHHMKVTKAFTQQKTVRMIRPVLQNEG